MSHQDVLQLADKMIAKISAMVSQSPFDDQRIRLEKFSNTLETKLLAVANEIEGDIRVLLERKLDSKTLREIMKIHREVLRIYNDVKINKQQPYQAAQKLVNFVTNSAAKDIIDELIVSTGRHVQSTNVDTLVGKHIIHPKNMGLRKLKTFANIVKSYIAGNPLLKQPTVPTIPVPKLTTRPVEETPFSYKEQETSVPPIRQK
jgi:hypothetical protein